MITVMHGKHSIDFARPLVELIGGVLVLLWLFADAPKHSKANVSAAGRIEFAPNKRTAAASLIMAAYSVYLVLQFKKMDGNPLSILIAVAFASIAIGLLTSYPATILIDSEGLQQIFWANPPLSGVNRAGSARSY